MFSVDRDVRIERVGLEDHGDVAVLRQHIVDPVVADEDVAFGHLLQTGDHAHRRRLAAARRPEQDEKLLIATSRSRSATAVKLPNFLSTALNRTEAIVSALDRTE